MPFHEIFPTSGYISSSKNPPTLFNNRGTHPHPVVAYGVVASTHVLLPREWNYKTTESFIFLWLIADSHLSDCRKASPTFVRLIPPGQIRRLTNKKKMKDLFCIILSIRFERVNLHKFAGFRNRFNRRVNNRSETNNKSDN